jgi:hypothetical protein
VTVSFCLLLAFSRFALNASWVSSLYAGLGAGLAVVITHLLVSLLGRLDRERHGLRQGRRRGDAG